MGPSAEDGRFAECRKMRFFGVGLVRWIPHFSDRGNVIQALYVLVLFYLFGGVYRHS